MTGPKRSNWWWIPSLYYAEGIPYVVVMMVSVIFYKRMGISNGDIALYTSWLYLPWVIKPLWSPVVDILKTKRWWIVITQLIVGAGLGGVALTIPLPFFFKLTLGFFWLLAFSSATHDIAADGFYMLGLSEHDQAWFVGIRSTFYRLAMITGQGLLIILAGYIESTSGLPTVELDVKAVSQPAIVNSINLEDIQSQQFEGDKRVIVMPEHLTISLNPLKKSTADSLAAFVKKRNIASGHMKADIDKQSISAEGENQTESWFSKTIISPLELMLKSTFGVEVERTNSEFTGNAGLVAFRLSHAPAGGETVVVNFGREFGDKSIQLVEGSRFVFTEKNWAEPALALIALDHRLKNSATASFRATAGDIPLAWAVTFGSISILFIIFFIYHRIVLPYPSKDKSSTSAAGRNFFSEYFKTFAGFFRKEHIIISIAFLLLYRLGESQLVKLASPFLLDAQEVGGLALTTGQVGFVYGTVGILMLTIGGLLGGFLAAKHGLKYWLWWMCIGIQLPDAVYVYLSYAQPDNFFIINLCVGIEQFGYGFGFTAYMLYMIYISEGEHKTTYFAITTGFMALGMMIPGMVSGWLQELIGYQHFFIWVLIATLPAFLILKFLPLDPEFGKKTDSES